MLFTFPLRYWFTIGVYGVFSLTGWCRQIQAGFLRSRLTQDTARPTQFVPTGLSPSMVLLSSNFSLMSISKCSPTTLAQHAAQVWALPFSLATTRGIIVIFFSCGYLDVSVLRVGSLLLERCTFSTTGCPIRKPRDISLVCSSPWLIAAYHVLHRLIDPRHPPYALICFKKVYSVLVSYHK